MRRRLDPKHIARAAILPLALVISPTPGDDPAVEDLVRLVYLAEVASYCSLVDDRVAEGFRRERDRLVEAGGLDEAAIEQARSEGWQRAHAEWQNRGLGGFRNWCRTEGEQAAARFRDLAPE